MARYIVILILVAALGFGAGRLTAPAISSVLQPVRATDKATQVADVATRKAVAAAAPTLETARTQREALRAEVATDDLDALIALADDAQLLASPAQRRASIKSIVERMAELDPAAALDYAHQLSDGLARNVALTTVIASVAQTDAQLAITMIHGISNGSLKQPLYHTAIRAMALQDPIRALELTRSLPGHASNWTNSIYGQWGRYDPQGALAHSATLTSQMGRRQAQWSALNAWLQSDENAAVGWFESAYPTLSAEERQLLTSMFAQSSPQVMERLAALAPVKMSTQLRRGNIMTLAGRDPATAAREFEQLPAQSRRDISASFVATEWAKSDRQAALAWAQQLTGEDRASAEAGVLSQWVRDDSDAALAYLATVDGPQRKEVTSVAIDALGQQDPAKAFAWVRSNPDAPFDRGIIISLARNWAERDPSAAVTALANAHSESWSRQPLQWTLHSLASDYPDQAMQWIDRMPTAQTRALATRAIASGLAQNDPEGALAWSQTLNGSARDESLAGVINGLNRNPERQYELAQTIQDVEIRRAATRIAIYSMGRQDTALATQWLASADLDDFQREELRRYLERQ